MASSYLGRQLRYFISPFSPPSPIPAPRPHSFPGHCRALFLLRSIGRASTTHPGGGQTSHLECLACVTRDSQGFSVGTESRAECRLLSGDLVLLGEGTHIWQRCSSFYWEFRRFSTPRKTRRGVGSTVHRRGNRASKSQERCPRSRGPSGVRDPGR